MQFVSYDYWQICHAAMRMSMSSIWVRSTHLCSLCCIVSIQSKYPFEKFRSISIRLHPDELRWMQRIYSFNFEMILNVCSQTILIEVIFFLQWLLWLCSSWNDQNNCSSEYANAWFMDWNAYLHSECTIYSIRDWINWLNPLHICC